jgi:malate dehydrogenase (oxaloacetate-decarboxylating)(NADP+)
MDRNETLFYRLVLDHIEEMLPILYTPTVGQACAQFAHIYRHPRGLYVTIDDVERLDALLANWYADEVDVVVATDGERVLGLGDLGAGGMGISIGKLTLYTAAGGIHPARTLPVCLDVGTNNPRVRDDPLYLGLRRPRRRGPLYERLVDAFVEAVGRRFPKALVQFEDFAGPNALRFLERHGPRARFFNDDIQGTGAVALAGLLSAMRLQGLGWEETRLLICGAGGAGLGIARAAAAALRQEGLDPQKHLYLADARGLLTRGRADLSEHQRPFAVRRRGAGDLAALVAALRPTALVGVTGTPGLFSRAVLEAMGRACPRPAIFPLSNPTTHAECAPDEARRATRGRAIVASGSPFAGVDQANNLYVFPGLGLGVVASGARRVSEGMLLAAARRLSELAPPARLFPPLACIRTVSAHLAQAVAARAQAEGLAERTATPEEIRRRMWEPRYLPYRPAP